MKPLIVILYLLVALSYGCKEVTPISEHTTDSHASPIAYLGGEPETRCKDHCEHEKNIMKWDCPDDKSFAPINVKLWAKTPVINGRLPTFDETRKGFAIHYYSSQKSNGVIPYNITLPKLAYTYSSSTQKEELVVVIQVVQTTKDTIAGFRYLTGGVGGALLRNFRFLTNDEIKKVTG